MRKGVNKKNTDKINYSLNEIHFIIIDKMNKKVLRPS